MGGSNELSPAVSSRAEIFTRLFESEFNYVWTSLRRLGVHVGDIEDVAHDVFLQVYGKLGSYDPTRPVRPWLFGFAFRVASDYRRLARHRREVVGLDCDPPTAEPLAEESLCDFEEQLLVAEALERVPFDRRAVLIAFELEQIPMKDIAEALEVPLHTAYSRLRVARQEFASAVRRCRIRRGEA